MTREELSDLIGRIYDCALDPALWSDTIGRVAAAVEAQAGLVMVHDLLDQASVRTFQSGVPTLAMRLYERRYAAANPIARFAATRSEGDVDTLRSMFPDGAWERSATYREWAWPLGIGDVLGMAVLRSERRGVWLGAARRGKGRPDFGPEQVRLFRLLAPHVVRSMRVSDILDLRKVEAGRLAEALDGLSAAVWLLDGEARVSHRNAAAERHAAQPGGGALRVVRGRLVASRPASSAACVIEGTTWSRRVFTPVIHVTVPSASAPATLSMTGPSAATTTGVGGASTSSPACTRYTSPLCATLPSRSSGTSTDRYSRMCRAGFSNE